MHDSPDRSRSAVRALLIDSAIDAPNSRRLLALALLGALLAAFRYAPVIDDPWDNSIESSTSATYFGRAEQLFQRLGFAELQGAPHFWVLPVKDGAVADDVAHGRYLNHPPLSFWLVHIAVEMVGWSERAFRLAPIVFSSLTAAWLVLIVGRWAGAGWAAAAIVLYLTLPMSWAVGWMVSYQPFVLSAMLASFVLHVRLRERTAGAYALTWIPVFFATLFDWCGAFIVPGICLYELLTPRGEPRRLGRALLLGIPVLLAVGSFVVLHGVWSGSVAAGVERMIDNATTTTLRGVPKGTTGEWFANQWKFWLELFTAPVAILAIVAFPYIIARARSAADALPRTGLALLVPAALDVVIFRNHSFDHEFWWSHGIAYVVVAVIVLIRGILAGAPAVLRPVAAVAVIGLLAWGGIDRIRTRHQAFATTEFRDLGREMNRFARPNDALLLAGMVLTESFYLEPWYLDTLGAVSYDSYRGMVDLKKNGSLLVDRIVGLVPEGASPDFTRENLARLRELGNVQVIEPETVAAEMPQLARRWPGRGFFVLTVE